MIPLLFIVIADANFDAIAAADALLPVPQIQSVVSMGGFTNYITTNLVPPGGTAYIMRRNANGSFLMSQSKQPAYVTALHTFSGWPVPA